MRARAEPFGYSIERCRELLEQNQGGCSRLYSQIRADTMQAEMTKNADAVRAALLDGEKTIAEIVRWAKANGAESIDMPICNMIIRRLHQDKEVAWTGKVWRTAGKIQGQDPQPAAAAAPAPPPAVARPVAIAPRPVPPPAPAVAPVAAPDRAWASVFDGMKDGDSCTLNVPTGENTSAFAQTVRNALNSKRETKGSRWSVNIMSVNTVRVMRLGERPSATAPAVPPPPPAAPPAAPPVTPSVEIAKRTESVEPPKSPAVAPVDRPRVMRSSVNSVLADLDQRIEKLLNLRLVLIETYASEFTDLP